MLSIKSWVQSRGNHFITQFESTSQKLILMFLLAGISYGATGLGAMLLMTLLANSQLGKEASSKHGISALESSRLGGLAVAIVILVYTLGFSLISPYTPGPVRDEAFLYLWCAIFFCCALGFAEDVKPDFFDPHIEACRQIFGYGCTFLAVPKIYS